jgi:hypothetical protein
MEDVRLGLASPEDEPSLHLRFAEERLEEVQALAERDVFDTAVLEALAEETAAALAGAESLPFEAAVPVLQDALRVTAEQEAVLSAVAVRASVLEQETFTRALQTSAAHRARALQLLGSISPPERPGKPGQTTPAPTLTPPAGATALSPWTPESSRTPVASATSTPAGESATPVGPTKTPQPKETPVPTETPVPPQVLTTPTPTSILPTATATTAPPTVTPESQGCVYGLGYWRSHPDAWSVSELTLGDETYTQAELLDLLNEPKGGDASLILAQQLIAAELNVASGADSSAVTGSIATANAWFASYAGRLTYGVKPSSPQGQEAVALANVLDQYNRSSLPGGPPKCP